MKLNQAMLICNPGSQSPFAQCLCTGETVDHSSLPCYVGTQAGNHQLKNCWESGWGRETLHDLVLEARSLVQWIPISHSSQVALLVLLETELNAFGQYHQWSQVKDAALPSSTAGLLRTGKALRCYVGESSLLLSWQSCAPSHMTGLISMAPKSDDSAQMEQGRFYPTSS